MFTKIMKALTDFRALIDERRNTLEQTISNISSTFVENIADEKIEQEQATYNNDTSSVRQAFALIVETTITDIKSYLLLQANNYNVDNMRDLQTILLSDIDLSDREQDFIFAEYDKCYLSHRLICKKLGIEQNLVENQMSILDKVFEDMTYVADNYNGELSISNATPEASAMLRLCSEDNFNNYLKEFDKNMPFTTSSDVANYLTPLTDEEVAAVDSLYKDCGLLEDIQLRTDALEKVGLRDVLAKTDYSRYLSGSQNCVETFLDSFPSDKAYLQRGFVQNLNVLGFGEELKNSKFAGLLESEN